MIDYSLSNLSVESLRNDDGTEIFSEQNNNIENLYQKAENIRLGIEYKMNPFT